MNKWEYMFVHSKNMEDGFGFRECSEVEQYLNELGAAGWEIVNLDIDYLRGRTGEPRGEEKDLFRFSGVAKRPKS